MEEPIGNITCMELDYFVEIINSNTLEDLSKICNYSTIGENQVNDCDCNHEVARRNDQDDMLASLMTEEFSSRKDLIEAVQQITFLQGYVTVIKKSKGEYYVKLGCDRGGQPRNVNPSDRQQKSSSSRLIGCPFELWGKNRKGIWKLEIKSTVHNHEPSKNMAAHPYCRRVSEEQLLEISAMTKAGIPPKQVISSLRNNHPGLMSTSRTVYNAKAKLKKEWLSGRSMLEALFDEFGRGGFIYDFRHDDDGHVSHLFFVHPYSLSLTKSYHNVFVMDCTYKTNKYKMPLLEIIGVTGTNNSFYSCFVAMDKEKENDYIWALDKFSEILGIENYPSVIVTDRELALMNAISVVFPHTINLLCVWHIEKNILAKCRKHFSTKKDSDEFLQRWTDLIRSVDEVSFVRDWNFLQEDYKEKAIVLDYITKTWLPLKEKFVYVWTEKHMHFGNHVTSRAEGAHSILKQYLQVSTGNFHDVKDKVCLAIENQFHEIKTKIASEQIRVTRKYEIELFRELKTHVSEFALGELYRQYELAISDQLPVVCRSHFKMSMGLPCSHMIKIAIGRGESLKLDDIHPQWRIDTRSFADEPLQDDDVSSLLEQLREKYPRMPLSQKKHVSKTLSELLNFSAPTQEPVVHVHKGRPPNLKKRKVSNSTKRNPCEFEIAEMNFN